MKHKWHEEQKRCSNIIYHTVNIGLHIHIRYATRQINS